MASYGLLPLLQNPSAKASDAAAGAGIGILGWGVTNFALGKLGSGEKPMIAADTMVTLKKWAPLLGGLLGGYAAFYAQNKSARANGHLVGASLTGLAITAAMMLQQQAAEAKEPDSILKAAFGAPSVSDYGSYGALVRNPLALQLNGLVRDPSVLKEVRMGRLMALAQGFSEEHAF